MTTLRTFQHALLVVYFTILVAAFGYTMLRVRTGYLWPFVKFEYMMMAPFQSYAKFNQELVIFGQRDDVWEEIDLAPYFPVLLGERNIRETNLYIGKDYGMDRRMQYEVMAQRILAIEEKAGRTYDSLRFEWWTWPASADGYHALKNREHAEDEIIFTYP